MFIEFPLDLFTYVSLFSVFIVAMTCYVTRQAKHPFFVQRFIAHDASDVVMASDMYDMPLCMRFVTFRQRKIPINEQSHASDEEGRWLLVCL
ncbi:MULTISPECIES: hypothetical protein [Anoxybacillus]|uniref:Uncharacterized protein n=1 Tax=Anoxybacillus flavithermus TaxID=33934 RepID=A0A178TBJ1_9BACL|nr:hypothetical protein [Anoxybacillus flavithermus]ASA96065.1 hypothetical protein CA592_04020 [Anoxybacillus flavithermus]ELK21838.1 hypothetical protein AF6_1515 [Anoxybacillus flavithermus TNO-09.006]MBE2906322.1 hypothetical protein [Anoxybacillus flavithermus]MBE2908963.1 hypothetical protein [Anoxybacillus flavithermus]MBE2911604.1 hypothetical protein [Anoxybacillus flavithermus]